MGIREKRAARLAAHILDAAKSARAASARLNARITITCEPAFMGSAGLVGCPEGWIIVCDDLRPVACMPAGDAPIMIAAMARCADCGSVAVPTVPHACGGAA